MALWLRCGRLGIGREVPTMVSVPLADGGTAVSVVGLRITMRLPPPRALRARSGVHGAYAVVRCGRWARSLGCKADGRPCRRRVGNL